MKFSIKLSQWKLNTIFDRARFFPIILNSRILFCLATNGEDLPPDYNFNGEPTCKNCQLATSALSEHNSEKLTSIYTNCQLSLVYNFKDSSVFPEAVQETFSQKFASLKSLHLLAANSLPSEFFAGFKCLVSLEICDDSLTTLPSSIFNIPTLRSFKLLNSSIQSFRNLREKEQSNSKLQVNETKISWPLIQK